MEGIQRYVHIWMTANMAVGLDAPRPSTGAPSRTEHAPRRMPLRSTQRINGCVTIAVVLQQEAR